MKIAALIKTENPVKLPLEFGIIIFLFSHRRATEIVSRGLRQLLNELSAETGGTTYEHPLCQ